MTQNKCTDCAVQQGYKPAEAVHQISEPLRLQNLEECRVMNLETIARLDSLNELQAVRIAELEAELAALKAAPAEPVQLLGNASRPPHEAWIAPSSCDSPKLCGVHKSCAGQYGTKKTCEANKAAPAAQAVEDEVKKLMNLAEAYAISKTSRDAMLADGYREDGLQVTAMQRQVEKSHQELADYVQELAALRATPPAQAVLDWNWVARLLDGRPLVRDGMGFGEHPEIPTLDEGMKPRAFFGALGIELKHTMAEDDLELDAHEAMNEAGNWSAWTPTAPEGDGWKLVAIFDTEDGQAAWWMREANAAPQAQDVQDAERYRWLQGNAADFLTCVVDATGRLCCNSNEADEAVDHAIAASAAKGA